MAKTSRLSPSTELRIRPVLPPRSKDGRPEGHPRRDIVNAVLYVAHNGISWRALPADFPPWQTVYGLFDRWKKAGVTAGIHDALRGRLRLAQGREVEPTAGVIDCFCCGVNTPSITFTLTNGMSVTSNVVPLAPAAVRQPGCPGCTQACR